MVTGRVGQSWPAAGPAHAIMTASALTISLVGMTWFPSAQRLTAILQQAATLICPVVRSAWLWEASKPVERRWRVDHDLAAQGFVGHPLAEGVDEVPVIGIDLVLVGMRPVGAPHDALGRRFDKGVGHRLHVVIRRQI